MNQNIGRYSRYIKPILFIIDILTINYIFIISFFEVTNYKIIFLLILNIGWYIIASQVNFYKVYRYTKKTTILNSALKQFFFSGILFFAMSNFFIKDKSNNEILIFIVKIFLVVLIIKILTYTFLQIFRKQFGGNFRRVILVGNENTTNPLKKLFTENINYGYRLKGVFDLEMKKTNDRLAKIKKIILEEKIDEIYFAIEGSSKTEIENLKKFTNNNFKVLKLIPREKDLVSENYKFEYYDYIPVIPTKEINSVEETNIIVKRIFDVLFSSFVIISILSWLAPIIAILIKLESKGSVLFIQKRNGLNNQVFNCYKFRSMANGKVTRVGKFIRKTSIDEMPQFINVLIGNMSVVGPRPHMTSHTAQYALKVNNFMLRHHVKPGITGLAQTKGCRGSIEVDSDIINRVKYDVFYVSNWTIILDFKIIFDTVFNVIKGDDKAY